jgi:AraC-like DNA-binding protein
MMVCLFWCIFFVVRAVRGEDEPRVKYTILLFYIASTVLYVNHWLFFSDHETTIGTYTYQLANLCVYPLYYMYLRALTRTKYTWDNYVLFVPAVLLSVFFPLNLMFPTRICFAVQVIWVWICGYRLLNATRSRMDNTYTDDRSYLLQPTHTLLILLGVTAVVSMLLNMLGRELFDGSIWIYLPAVLMSILLFSLGYVAAHTTLPQETVLPEEAHKEDKATTEETDALMHKIATVLREEQLFSDSNLTIQDLANAVGSNRTYVSNCINRRTGLSFSQYIARYRVEYAQTVLVDPQYADDHEALTHAISLSGFSSNQTFYRLFKEITGLTPLQYRHQNR